MRPDGGTDDSSPDPARPRSFDARYGDGVVRAVSLGGGGTWFVAWQLGYLQRLAHHDVRVADADRLVGTSAGSIVASTLAHGRLLSLFLESEVLSLVPGVMKVLFPASADTPSQRAALDRYLEATDAEVGTITAIGAAARAADTPPPETMARDLVLVVGEHWGSDALWMTAVDTRTAERCVLTRDTGVSTARGAAASSAVPGIFAPQPVAGRTCMDGGVSGTGVHLDLLAGAGKALVLSLYRDDELTEARLTLAPGDLTREVAALRASGTDVLVCTPTVPPAPAGADASQAVRAVMDPATAHQALHQGAAQADEEFELVGAFWD